MLLKELAAIAAPSGFEDKAREYIKNHAECDEMYTDSIGNLVCRKKGKGKKVMIAAHMDEVGLIITDITEKGFLKFAPLGGIDSTVLCGQRVFIGNGKIPGIIGIKAIHLQERGEEGKRPKMKELYIDIGAKDKADAQKYVKKGDCVTFDDEYVEFGNSLVKSKALDDRVGCAVMLRLMEHNYDSDMYFVFTAQEEIGTRGAKVAAYNIKPDIALVLEGTICSDVYGTKEHEAVTRLGDGVAMTAIDGAAISDKDYFEFIKDLAKKENIKLQIKKTTMGGTDARSIVQSNCGVKTAVLAVPCRYIHSPVSVMHTDDYECMYALSRAVLDNIEGSGLC